MLTSFRQRSVGHVVLAQALILAAVLIASEGFSVLVPQNQLFTKRMIERAGGQMLRKEIPLEALLASSEEYRGNIFKRAKDADSKPATCTCTCETKPVDEEQAYKRLLSSASKLRNSHHKHETPATCTCSCETHPLDEEKSSKADSVPLEQSPSLFWSPFDYDAHESPMSDQPENKHGGGEDYYSKDSSDKDYQGTWGHESRYPWKRLPDTICYRERCTSDDDCCMRYNICDRSAKVCVDCWYGASCSSERDCCFKYPICKMESYQSHSGQPGDTVQYGKCVDKV